MAAASLAVDLKEIKKIQRQLKSVQTPLKSNVNTKHKPSVRENSQNTHHFKGNKAVNKQINKELTKNNDTVDISFKPASHHWKQKEKTGKLQYPVIPPKNISGPIKKQIKITNAASSSSIQGTSSTDLNFKQLANNNFEHSKDSNILRLSSINRQSRPLPPTPSQNNEQCDDFIQANVFNKSINIGSIARIIDPEISFKNGISLRLSDLPKTFIINKITYSQVILSDKKEPCDTTVYRPSFVQLSSSYPDSATNLEYDDVSNVLENDQPEENYDDVITHLTDEINQSYDIINETYDDNIDTPESDDETELYYEEIENNAAN